MLNSLARGPGSHPFRPACVTRKSSHSGTTSVVTMRLRTAGLPQEAASNCWWELERPGPAGAGGGDVVEKADHGRGCGPAVWAEPAARFTLCNPTRHSWCALPRSPAGEY